jgi:hypothetical protein
MAIPIQNPGEYIHGHATTTPFHQADNSVNVSISQLSLLLNKYRCIRRFNFQAQHAEVAEIDTAWRARIGCCS